MLTRPSTTGSAAVPRTCKLAVPCNVRVRLTRFSPFVDSTFTASCTFCAIPCAGGATVSPENCPMKSFKSKSGVNESWSIRTFPLNSAACGEPVNASRVLTASRTPSGYSMRRSLPSNARSNCIVGL